MKLRKIPKHIAAEMKVASSINAYCIIIKNLILLGKVTKKLKHFAIISRAAHLFRVTTSINSEETNYDANKKLHEVTEKYQTGNILKCYYFDRYKYRYKRIRGSVLCDIPAK